MRSREWRGYGRLRGLIDMWSEMGSLLLEKRLTLAVAESFTGGLISQSIVFVPGASGYYLLGVTAYDNEAKESVLGVRHETLIKYGAVSRETAEEMAEGVRRIAGSDIGLSTTGIAGPTGGTEEKPVGLAYIAISNEKSTIVKRFVFTGDRGAIMKQGAEKAGKLLAECLSAYNK